jgi:hypothetical protein
MRQREHTENAVALPDGTCQYGSYIYDTFAELAGHYAVCPESVQHHVKAGRDLTTALHIAEPAPRVVPPLAVKDVWDTDITTPDGNIHYGGFVYETVEDVARHYGIPVAVIAERLYRGMSLSCALMLGNGPAGYKGMLIDDESISDLGHLTLDDVPVYCG